MDSATEGDFSEKLDVLEKHWSELEKACGARSGFFDWFTRNKSAQIINTMLKPVREEAGLVSSRSIHYQCQRDSELHHQITCLL